MATCYNSYYRRYYTCSSWSTWGRWVVVGVIIFVALLFFFLCSCFSQRRRRKANKAPFYGTGWTYNLPGGKPNTGTNYQAPPPQYGQQETNTGYYAPPTNTYAPPTTSYAPPANNNYGGGANQSYFGGSGRNDVEMQPPQNVYNSQGYSAPAGPPPGKNY